MSTYLRHLFRRPHMMLHAFNTWKLTKFHHLPLLNAKGYMNTTTYFSCMTYYACMWKAPAQLSCVWRWGVLQSLQENAGKVPQIRLWPFPSTSFPINHSLIISSFDSMSYWQRCYISKRPEDKESLHTRLT